MSTCLIFISVFFVNNAVKYRGRKLTACKIFRNRSLCVFETFCVFSQYDWKFLYLKLTCVRSREICRFIYVSRQGKWRRIETRISKKKEGSPNRCDRKNCLRKYRVCVEWNALKTGDANRREKRPSGRWVNFCCSGFHGIRAHTHVHLTLHRDASHVVRSGFQPRYSK